MKRVFNRKKCIEDIGIEEYYNSFDDNSSWIDECHGLTTEEIKKIGIWNIRKMDGWSRRWTNRKR